MASTHTLLSHRPARAGRRWKTAVFGACAAVLVAGSAFHPPAEPAMTVVIDAGHGGKDPGNLGTGRYRIAEKDITLAAAQSRYRRALERLSGLLDDDSTFREVV